MGLREEIATKRLELSVMEADVRVEDLEAEIDKIKERKVEMVEKLKELKGDQ